MTVKEMQFYIKVRSEQTIRKIIEQMEKEELFDSLNGTNTKVNFVNTW